VKVQSISHKQPSKGKDLPINRIKLTSWNSWLQVPAEKPDA